jgi:hypothetical protein
MKQTIQIKVPRVKRRCVELYGRDTPFRPKVVESKRRYQRHSKNQRANQLDF